ncbi:MAG TPA: YkvA family protein [Polyangiaceae bacterium]|jgi:uncharacterized membrane protein YkvA (DUF1232 family)|nr:YkvA family protein [Polyangiaceae bacterium]
MTDLDTRCLDTFPEWLKSLADDATELASVLESDSSPAVKRHVASSLNYLFKSLDLIPDGIEDLGFMDDAFVLRVASKMAASKAEGEHPTLDRLAAGVPLIQELLDKEYPRLVAYVEGLLHGAARGRTTDEIVDDADVRAQFIGEIRAWAASYEAPSFARDPKNLVKLTSFLSAKLPA